MKRILIISAICVISFIAGVCLASYVIMNNAEIISNEGVFEVDLFGETFIYE